MQSPHRLQSLLLESEVVDAVFIVDESGTILFCPQLTDMCGYAFEELQGRSVEWLVPARFRMAHIGQRIRFTDERKARPLGAGRGLLLCRKGGSERSVKISLRPVQPRDSRGRRDPA